MWRSIVDLSLQESLKSRSLAVWGVQTWSYEAGSVCVFGPITALVPIHWPVCVAMPQTCELLD